jgi:hypothetical protein
MRNWSIVVKKTGRTYGVYGRIAGQPDDLIEGGFFSKAVAETARDNWERECVQNEVEDAERHAGWDPNP